MQEINSQTLSKNVNDKREILWIINVHGEIRKVEVSGKYLNGTQGKVNHYDKS